MTKKKISSFFIAFLNILIFSLPCLSQNKLAVTVNITESLRQDATFQQSMKMNVKLDISSDTLKILFASSPSFSSRQKTTKSWIGIEGDEIWGWQIKGKRLRKFKRIDMMKKWRELGKWLSDIFSLQKIYIANKFKTGQFSDSAAQNHPFDIWKGKAARYHHFKPSFFPLIHSAWAFTPASALIAKEGNYKIQWSKWRHIQGYFLPSRVSILRPETLRPVYQFRFSNFQTNPFFPPTLFTPPEKGG